MVALRGGASNYQSARSTHQRHGQRSLQFESVSSPTAATQYVSVPATDLSPEDCRWPAGAGSRRSPLLACPALGHAASIQLTGRPGPLAGRPGRGSNSTLARPAAVCRFLCDLLLCTRRSPPACPEDVVAAKAAAAVSGAGSCRIRPADGTSLGWIAGRSTESWQRWRFRLQTSTDTGRNAGQL